jgi:hypothetical protein
MIINTVIRFGVYNNSLNYVFVHYIYLFISKDVKTAMLFEAKRDLEMQEFMKMFKKEVSMDKVRKAREESVMRKQISASLMK